MVFSTAVLLLLCFPHLASSVSHSLSLLVTYIYGETPFPDLTLVLTVNNIPVEYYDSNIKKVVSRRHWRSDDSIEDAESKYFVVENVYRSMKLLTHRLINHYNHTNGIRVYQKFAACDLEGNKLSRFFLRDAYEGEETRSYDILGQLYDPHVPELFWSKLKMEAKKLTYVNVYQPLCLKVLRQYLQQDKNVFMRKVRPKVRLIQKKDSNTGRTQVSCLATGFFPRHINLTLLRDGQPVPDQEITSGEVLPNGDGTYQMRKSTIVSEEESVYTCTVTHLDKKEDFGLEVDADLDVLFLSLVLGSVLIATSVLIVIIVRQIRTGPQCSCQTPAAVRYTAAQITEQADSGSSTSSSTEAPCTLG